MADSNAWLRIREGAFTYLLAADRSMAIEHRHGDALEPAEKESAPVVAWHRVDGQRMPVVRLGHVLHTRVGPWEHAILMSRGEPPLAVAAGHVEALSQAPAPAIQPFNPVGCILPDGSPIVGVCPGTESEHLVLDSSRLLRCLRRVLVS